MNIKHEKYEILLNLIGYWLISNNRKFNKRNTYEYQGRTADLATIENVLLSRKKTPSEDGLTGRYVEASIVDNSDYSFLPNYVTYEGKQYLKANVIDMVQRVLVYEQKNGRIPLTVETDINTTINNTTTSNCTNPYTSKPHPTKSGCNGMGQNTSVYCAPSSVHKSLHKFGITDITQSQLASWMGTTSGGTSHQGIETGIAKVNKNKKTNIKIEWFNLKDLGWEKIGKLLCQPNKAVFCHILYKNGGTCNGTGNFGHYELLTKVNLSTKYVQVLNSLGNKCGSCYCGFYQDRTMACQEKFMSGISQKSICVLTKQ